MNFFKDVFKKKVVKNPLEGFKTCYTCGGLFKESCLQKAIENFVTMELPMYFCFNHRVEWVRRKNEPTYFESGAYAGLKMKYYKEVEVEVEKVPRADR